MSVKGRSGGFLLIRVKLNIFIFATSTLVHLGSIQARLAPENRTGQESLLGIKKNMCASALSCPAL